MFPVPNLIPGNEYSGVTLPEVMDCIVRKMALGDAILAAQVKKYAHAATHLITWNAKHFKGKIAIPVLTPAEWLAANPAP